MDIKIRRLLERFPEHSDAIKSLHDTNEKFGDLIADHHDVSEEFETMKGADRESQHGRAAELKSRRAALEEELLTLMENHQRI